jgi:hypothetical protein
MDKDTIIATYATRKKTIRQIAEGSEMTYEEARRILLEAGYSNGLKKR